MDFQVGFDIALALVGALGGWILKALHSEIKEARHDHAALVQLLPGTYARRDDVKDGFRRIEDTLDRIEDKLGAKVDR